MNPVLNAERLLTAEREISMFAFPLSPLSIWACMRKAVAHEVRGVIDSCLANSLGTL